MKEVSSEYKDKTTKQNVLSPVWKLWQLLIG